MSEWISVKDRLPEPSQLVIAHTDCRLVKLLCCPDEPSDLWCDDRFGEPPHEMWSVTHWMPLPAPPEVK